MQIDYIAETIAKRRLRAWLMPADPDDDIEDPRIPRPDGWRLVIEDMDDPSPNGLLRSAWEREIGAVLSNMESFWTEKPVWRVHQTGDAIDLYALLGVEW